MIVRIWRGRASASRSPDYPEHFRRRVLPELKGIAGFLGASLLQRAQGDGVEFVVLTRWTSVEAIQTFAGHDIDKAVVEPDAIAALVDFDEAVQHYESIEEVVP